jgi:microcystin-dependent protein
MADILTTKYFFYPFSEEGDKTAIPNDASGSGFVSYEQGWTIDYTKNPNTDASGKDVPRRGFNQVLYDATLALKQYQIWGIPNFVSTADNEGDPFPYPKGVIVLYDAGSGARKYESLEEDNEALPTDATKWALISHTSNIPVGTSIEFTGIAAPDGFLYENGAAVSRTTYAALFALYKFVQTADTTSGSPTITGLTTANMHLGMAVTGTGIPVSTTIIDIDIDGVTITLSANATASNVGTSLTFHLYGAGDGSTTFNIRDKRRRVGVGDGGTLTDTLYNTVGSTGGEEEHQLTVAEMPSHFHDMPEGGPGVSGGRFSSTNLVGDVFDTNYTGGDAPHNNMQPSIVAKYCVKY